MELISNPTGAGLCGRGTSYSQQNSSVLSCVVGCVRVSAQTLQDRSRGCSQTLTLAKLYWCQTLAPPSSKAKQTRRLAEFFLLASLNHTVCSLESVHPARVSKLF